MSNVVRETSGVLVSVPEGTRLHDAAKRMAQAKVGAVLVVDRNGRQVGIVTERDLCHRLVATNARPSEHAVEDVMSRPALVLVEGRTSIEEALRIMADNHVRHLPLLDWSGKPIGMVSLQRLMRHRLDGLENENTSLAAFVGADGPGGD